MSGIEEQAIAVLRAIVAEVAGPQEPLCEYSSLPACLIHDARQAIEAHERCHEQAIARRQQEAQA